MEPRVIITELEKVDPESRCRMARYRRNADWLSEHGPSFWENHRGKYVAVSEGEVFVSEDAWEARRQAKAKHPDDTPFVQYMPRQRAVRIDAS